MTDRIHSVCVAEFPGANRALVNLSRNTALTRHVALASADPRGAEVAFLAAHLGSATPPLTIFGGWSSAYEPIVAALAARRARCAVYWTSSLGQTEMSAEGEKLTRVLADERIRHLFCAGADAAQALSSSRPGGVPHLPATMILPARVPSSRRADAEPIVVTLFFPRAEVRRKNALNCLAALSQLGAGFRLVLNGLSRAPQHAAVLRALDLRYEERDWMSEVEYERVVAGADLGLQVSFAETYGYVAADHLARGVPVIGSPMVPVLDRLTPPLRRRLVVERADSAAAIRDRIRDLCSDRAAARRIGMRARRELRAANAGDVRAATALLQRFVRGVD